MRKLSLILIIFTFVLYSQSLPEVISTLKGNSDKVKDLQADVIMEMDMGEAGKRTQEMTVWSKGKDRMRMEMNEAYSSRLSADSLKTKERLGKTTMIINGDKMLMITPEGEKRLSADSSRLTAKKAQPTPPGLDMQKGMEEFLKKNETTVLSAKDNKIVLEVIPEEKSPLMEKVELTVDMKRGVVTSQSMFSSYGTTKMQMEYEEIKGAWVLKKVSMIIPTPVGKVGRMTVEYKNIKINQGLKDEMFEV